MKKCVLLSGPMGTGKRVIREIMLRLCPDLRLCVSATTRLPRGGEVEGEDYYFISRAEFLRRLDAEEFLEHVEITGNLYGTLASELQSVRPGTLIHELDPFGHLEVRERFAGKIEIHSIFLLPPSPEEHLRRLRGREDEHMTEAELAERIARADKELELLPLFKAAGAFVIVNETDRQEEVARRIVDHLNPYLLSIPLA